jgi:hypothetical protein
MLRIRRTAAPQTQQPQQEAWPVNKQDLYSELYREGEQVLRDNNPCKIQGGKCMAGEFCCGGCKHLGPNGCTVEALACKLWLCYKATTTAEGARTIAQFKVIKLIAVEHKVPTHLRASKEENFRP